MKQVQRGFTLIELVMVIVILGVLAAVALPKFVDLKGDAEAAAVSGMAGGLASASSINYAGCAVMNQVASTTDPKKCVKVAKCSDVGTLLLPSLNLTTTASATAYYLLADTAVATNGATATCELRKGTGTTIYSASYGAVGAAN